MNAEIRAGAHRHAQPQLGRLRAGSSPLAPRGALWPRCATLLTLDELNDQERWDLAVVLHPAQARQRVLSTRATAGVWTCHYIAAWHRAPSRQAPRELPPEPAVLLVPSRSQQNQVSGGSESGMALWVSDTTPELIAKRFHELGPIDIEG